MAAEAGGDVQGAVQEYIMHHTMTNPDSWAVPFLKIPLPGWLSLHALMLVFCAVLLLVVFGLLYRKQDAVPRGLTNALEAFILFVRDQITIPNLGEADGRKMTPLFCSLFFFILGLNVLGLIPLFATATSNINVTAALALITLTLMVGGGIWRHGPLGFVKSLMPHGVPWPVMIILFPIEVMGVFIKPFALTIRLFANMLSGHIVLFSIVGLTVTFGVGAAVPAVALATGIYLLEIMVALIQAYIFTMLSAMFVGSFLHPSH